jgi:hypothetical protein
MFHFFSCLMVVNNFNIFWPIFGPNKANSVPVIDADRMLPLPVSRERFKMVAWGYTQILKICGDIKLGKLTQGGPLETLKSVYPLGIRQFFGIPVPIRDNHTLY